MRTEKNIFIAFILNLLFSGFEFVGGFYTGSIAIISDAVHDLGDAASIGISYLLEKKSKKEPDEKYTYGYARYSVVGGAITTIILLFSSFIVIINAAERIVKPTEINYSGMIIVGIMGIVINLAAAYFTHDGDSLNQKAVNLHMLEDVLGWVAVLTGAVIMRFTDLSVIDPLMSMGVAVFIIIGCIKNLKLIIDIVLDKTPCGISVSEIKERLLEIDGITDVHHIHLRSIDGHSSCATLHIVTDSDMHIIKQAARNILTDLGISHATIETESSDEHCEEAICNVTPTAIHTHNHNH